MKVSLRHHLMGFVVLGLISILSTSACSIAVPEFLHISNIELTDDETKIHFTISDDDYNNWEVVYNLFENQIQTLGSEQIITDLGMRPTIQNYITRLYENNGLSYWELKDSENNLLFNIEIELNTSDIVFVSENLSSFFSVKLNTAYLIIPNFLYDTSIVEYDGEYATVVIAQMDNLENLTYLVETEWYRYGNSFSIYDEYQLLRLQGNGADCVNSVYFTFGIDTFDFLVKTTAGQRELLDHRSGFMYVSSYQWAEHTSTLQTINLNDYETHAVTWESEQLRAIIDDDIDTISDSLTLPVLSLIGTAFCLFAIVFLRKRS